MCSLPLKRKRPRSASASNALGEDDGEQAARLTRVHGCLPWALWRVLLRAALRAPTPVVHSSHAHVPGNTDKDALDDASAVASKLCAGPGALEAMELLRSLGSALGAAPWFEAECEMASASLQTAAEGIRSSSFHVERFVSLSLQTTVPELSNHEIHELCNTNTPF